MKIKIVDEILIIDILSFLLILSIIFIPSTAARVILGLPFLLFFPGYTLVSALFVEKEGMGRVERLALSSGMSIAIVALIGFGLNFTPWGIRLEPILYFITTFIFVTSVVALIRKARLLKTNRFTIELSLNLPQWRGDNFSKSLSIILIIAIFGALGVLGYSIATPKIGERFTEFYILGINGKTQRYPIEFVMDNGSVTQIIYSDGSVDTVSGSGSVTLGIVNHEQQTVIYSVKMTIDDNPVNVNFGGKNTDVLGPIRIQQGEKWENAINFVPKLIGDNQKVELLLFKGIEIEPEDSLRLSINVKQAE